MTRTGSADNEIGGFTIPAGTDVVCWNASANRDEAAALNADDSTSLAKTLAGTWHSAGFAGFLGSWLARLELQVVFGTILDRFPTPSSRTSTRQQHHSQPSEELVIDLRPSRASSPGQTAVRPLS